LFFPFAFVLTNDAVADMAFAMVSVQLSVPVQAPLQPLNAKPLPGLAVRVTDVPTG